MNGRNVDEELEYALLGGVSEDELNRGELKSYTVYGVDKDDEPTEMVFTAPSAWCAIRLCSYYINVSEGFDRDGITDRNGKICRYRSRGRTWICMEY